MGIPPDPIPSPVVGGDVDNLEEEIAAAMGADEELAPADAEQEEAEPLEEQDPAEEETVDTEPSSEAQAEAIGKEWDRVAKYLARNLGEIAGDDAVNYSECMMCRYWGTPGFVPHIECPPDLAIVLAAYSGVHAAQELETDYASETCPKCQGHGELATGSKVMGQEKLPCPNCKALGWVPVGSERAGTALLSGNGISPAMSPGATEFVPPTDPSEYDSMTVAELKAAGGMIVPPFVTSA